MTTASLADRAGGVVPTLAGLLLGQSLGIGMVLMALYAVALSATALGLAPPGALAALDPATDASLPTLWADMLLAIAGGAALAAAGRDRARMCAVAFVPLILLVSDSGDLPARLADMLVLVGWPFGPAKLLAGIALGALAALASLWLACQGDQHWRMHGLACLTLLSIGGACSLTFDALGREAALSNQVYLLSVLEEISELIFYTLLAYRVGNFLAGQPIVSYWDRLAEDMPGW